MSTSTSAKCAANAAATRRKYATPRFDLKLVLAVERAIDDIGKRHFLARFADDLCLLATEVCDIFLQHFGGHLENLVAAGFRRFLTAPPDTYVVLDAYAPLSKGVMSWSRNRSESCQR